MKSTTGLHTILNGLVLCTASLAATDAPKAECPAPPGREPFYAIVEAEEMDLKGDWKIVQGNEGYCPAYPNNWSGNRIRGGAGPEEAVATKEIEIPADGKYALWVRFESSYGFDAWFSIEIRQTHGRKGGAFSQTFGDRDDLKCFTGTWRVQGPWAYHNTDYVYQKSLLDLKQGKAIVTLSKGANGKHAAARLIDLVAITDDVEKEQGAEMMGWKETNDVAPILRRCTTPVYLRVKAAGDQKESFEASLFYGLHHPPGGGHLGGMGPKRNLRFTRDGMLNRSVFEVNKIERARAWKMPDSYHLPAGYDSGWQRLDMSRFCPGRLNVTTTGNITIMVCRRADGRGAAEFDFAPGSEDFILVGTGNARLEDLYLQGEPARRYEDIVRSFVEELNRLKAPGKRPYKFIFQPAIEGLRGDMQCKFMAACGASGMYFSCVPELYTRENAAKWGINRASGSQALQNASLRREHYEGDYTKFRAALEKRYDGLKEKGLGDIPIVFKMIEESGPPRLDVLGTWPIIAERFREYLKGKGFAPADFVPRPSLAKAVAEGKTAEGDLWPLVMLSTGTPQAAAENPRLFYYSKLFASDVFCDNAVNATRIIEEIFPKGSRTNCGAIFPQVGHGVRRNWYDEFMLYRKRGMTAFGSEMTWALCGTPDYVGPQSESFQGTIGRGVKKYHNALLGSTYILASHLYGYPAEYVELVTYALVSHGFKQVHYYPCGGPESAINAAVKTAGYKIGAIEDEQTESDVVASKIAIGWSETTAIWDQAETTFTGFNMPGNVMYQLERHYLYLLLRHMQLPCDLLSEADIAEGRLEGYRVYFLVGDHLSRSAAEALRKWVDSGGVLISCAGGGLWDEFNEPLDTLKDVFGIKGARQYAKEQGREYIPGEAYQVNVDDNKLEKMEQALRVKLELIHAHPVDEITLDGFGGGKLPVLGYRQGLAVEGGKTIGTFRRGNAAIVANRYGKGRGVIMGFLPGISYLYKAFPKVPYGRGGEDLSNYLYPDCKPLVRDAMAGIFRAVCPDFAGAVTASDPYVEANLFRNKNGKHHIALVNYRGRKIEALEVRIKKSDVGGAASARATFGKASVKDGGEFFTVTVQLDKFEWLSLMSSGEQDG